MKIKTAREQVIDNREAAERSKEISDRYHFEETILDHHDALVGAVKRMARHLGVAHDVLCPEDVDRDEDGNAVPGPPSLLQNMEALATRIEEVAAQKTDSVAFGKLKETVDDVLPTIYTAKKDLEQLEDTLKLREPAVIHATAAEVASLRERVENIRKHVGFRADPLVGHVGKGNLAERVLELEKELAALKAARG